MRISALALIAGLGLAAMSGVADARVWTDPAGRVTFDMPAGWSVSNQNDPNATYVIAGTANNECHIISIPREQLANASVPNVIRAAANDAQFTPESWAARANALPGIFPNNSANVLSRSSETPGVWPIQRAEIQGPERLVHAALQVRPGFELFAYCQTYEGADTTSVYDSVIRSVAHPNDAAWAAAAAPAAPAEPAAAPAPSN